MERSSREVSDHIESLPDDVRSDIVILDGLLAAAFAGEERVLWEGKFWGGTDQEIIGYGRLEQPRPDGSVVDWFKVGLAIQKDHLSVYVNAAEDGRYLGQVYGDRLGKVKLGAASIGFKSVESLDLQVFEEMIERARDVMA